MRRRLFLTGPMGCGKSTAIRAALGPELARCGGLLACRHRRPALHFTLQRPGEAAGVTFLDFASGKPEADLGAFTGDYLRGSVLVLDEIGGIELLSPEFCAELDRVLSADIPILGVLKGEGAADKLAAALGLAEEYSLAAARLRQRLLADPDTLVYECSQYDENARALARAWKEEYLHEGLLRGV